MKELLIKRLANLLSVKSIVTLVMTGAFCWLVFSGRTDETFSALFTTIIGFYFGYQSKAEGESK